MLGVQNLESYEFKLIDVESDVLEFSISPVINYMVFVSSDALLYKRTVFGTSDKERVLSWDNAKYTQLSFSSDGRLFAVRLSQGTSSSTQLVEIDINDDTYTVVVDKRTAQFTPHFAGNDVLYYSTALCVNDCEKQIWEIWYRDSISGVQEQLTMLNSLSRSPSFHQIENTVYFESNQTGRPALWSLDVSGYNPPKLVRQMAGNIIAPSVSSSGQVYVIHQGINEDKIIYRDTKSQWSEIELIPGIRRIRNLNVW
ncbi:TolB family protein [Vibrio astriarenae]